MYFYRRNILVKFLESNIGIMQQNKNNNISTTIWTDPNDPNNKFQYYSNKTCCPNCTIYLAIR